MLRRGGNGLLLYEQVWRISHFYLKSHGDQTVLTVQFCQQRAAEVSEYNVSITWFTCALINNHPPNPTSVLLWETFAGYVYQNRVCRLDKVIMLRIEYAHFLFFLNFWDSTFPTTFEIMTFLLILHKTLYSNFSSSEYSEHIKFTLRS